MNDWRSVFSYDGVSGSLLWNVPRPKRKVGSVAGNINTRGRYRTVHATFNGIKKRYPVHRVIWEMHFGEIKSGMCIDHIDGDGLNNKIENLRLTTLSGNQRNRKLVRTSKTGIHGVCVHKNGYSVYCANVYQAWTKDFFEACCIRKSAERLHGYHINHGRMA